MKWIVVAILLLIIPYTIITLRYRKPGPAFQPYEDMKNRANVARLLSAGYRRIPLAATIPAEGGTRAAGGASITGVTGGLPEGLRSTLVEPLLLPSEIGHVTAAALASALTSYAIQLTCILPNDKQQLGGAELFLRDKEMVIAPTFEPVAGELLTRSRQTTVLLTIPAGTLAPGHYEVTLAAERQSATWNLEVR